MKEVTLNAYLFFTGNAKEAMEFYKSIFGGDLSLTTYGEVPGDKNPNTIGMDDQIIHASLSGGDIDLMASDSPYKDKIHNGKISLSLTSEDEEKMRNIFDNLSEGGKVNQPLDKGFWGDIFGMLTDKYDVDWMIDIRKQNQS